MQNRVAVIGAGGLGGCVILLLARLGIGQLTVVDPDVFDETNLNRQALCTPSALGRSKAEEAARVVGSINPAVEVRAFPMKLDTGNACDMLSGANVVVDALDNLPDRFILEEAAKGLKIPLVHGALAGFGGQILTIFPEDSGLRQIYGDNPSCGEKCERPESVLGVPGVTPSVVASFQAMEVIKIILKRGKVLRNGLVYIDLESGELSTFPITI